MTMEAAETTTTDSAAAYTTTAASYKRSPIEARSFVSSCQAPGTGSSIQLIPDFSQSRGIDFSRIEIVFVTIVSGLEVISIQAVFESDGSINAIIPSSIGGGQVFIFITIVDISGRSLSDSEILFGPAVFEREFFIHSRHFDVLILTHPSRSFIPQHQPVGWSRRRTNMSPINATRSNVDIPRAACGEELGCEA
jgi:hypothetical protein